MRSFQQIIVALFALLVCAFAQDNEQYDATVYVTSTVYRINTITMSGASPTASVANMTSTISAAQAPAYPTNGTSIVQPSGTGVQPSQSQFTGAASALTAQAYVAALVAGVGYLVL
ncbi:hypothetical protein HBI56_052410 [Parastagonospora nodorum]|uniref:Uncharacterized protein n=2 Tax=Phaeosphaeria nodorum (strain SN15 / ATCC MYA-4574 / FGSC 10173) TaxID=321614 RepID=A0A7U2ICU1_PHANO|nr:hypothetical protein SNOG_13134 [Parastagonospora nodorum SN15]KAH3914171.1 hypothetical protein HBH56_099740 [Parastagonospora nodorum]EAT79461.1 hypothetical protein SNOG_13134 [Parastagonospora nodorum SN15]KAH3930411.1 hypothetical protein HBH54_114060 [Parastagonospora nodorum]KAH3942793.1 hypothetical protein HBH53_181900 [Parastagonospora nodorum]KAH3964564.1 hypothetical protein HBH51_158000 [Parastagonospora nodorum]